LLNRKHKSYFVIVKRAIFNQISNQQTIVAYMKKLLIIAVLCYIHNSTAAQLLSTSRLPILIINTNGQAIPDDPKIMADMGIIYNGAGAINNLTDPYNYYNGKIGIEIRGQSSQQFPMKSYGIELWDAAGASVNKSLFGMPSESDWVLYAPYTDKTLMRNVLAYTISREMGHWASGCRYVEVVLNNTYVGVYVLMEKIKRGSGRLPVTKLNATDISGDAVTGGYIFAIDKSGAGDDGWTSQYRPAEAAASQTIRFWYNYPKASAIAPEQKNYIKAYTDSFENAVNSAAFQDPVNGYRKFADVNSFIDYLIVNEVSRNVDGYRLSTYLFKDRSSKGGKLNAGPVWDYDLAFRNADYCKGSTIDGWAYDFNSVCNQDYWQIPFWWGRFMQDTAFKATLRCRWKKLRQTTLSDQHLFSFIDSAVTVLDGAQQRHFQQWPVLGRYVWPNPQPIPSTYIEEISTLKQWLAARLDWIDKNLPNTGACSDWPLNEAGTFKIVNLPNPFNNQAGVMLQSKKAQSITYTVTDIAGRTMYAEKFPVPAGYTTLTNLQTMNWCAGIYFLVFTNDTGEKIIKKILKN
jgi:CotH kinase protein/Secretion system C-terminal sorting domain